MRFVLQKNKVDLIKKELFGYEIENEEVKPKPQLHKMLLKQDLEDLL